LEKQPTFPPLSHASTFATLTSGEGNRAHPPQAQTHFSPVSVNGLQHGAGWDPEKASELHGKDEQASSSSSVTEKPLDELPYPPLQPGWKKTWTTLACLVLSALL